jgi:hypothetical protein
MLKLYQMKQVALIHIYLDQLEFNPGRQKFVERNNKLFLSHFLIEISEGETYLFNAIFSLFQVADMSKNIAALVQQKFTLFKQEKLGFVSAMK